MNPVVKADTRGQGMNSTLKVVLPLVLLVVVVSGVTLISLGVGDRPPTEEGSVQYSPPLYFALTEMAYDPTSDSLAKRTFPQFVEPTGGRQVPVSFWFYNPHPVPVRVAILRRSCTSCSAARLAVVPPEALRAVTARGAVAGGLSAPEHPGDLIPPLAEPLLHSLAWQDFNLERPDQAIEVPPGSAEAPTWGVLQFGVVIAVVGPKPLSVEVGLAAGDNPQVPMPFHMVLTGVYPFEVAKDILMEGTWRWVVRATDADGNKSKAERSFTVNNTLGFLELSKRALKVTKKRGATLRISFRVANRARVSVAVENQLGQVVRMLESRVLRKRGQVALTWNARTESGRVATPGVYAISVTATNGLGTVELEQTVTLRRRGH